jgi:galacturan 1,4-alpha-galacturonidase
VGRSVRSKWLEVVIGESDCHVDDYGAKGDGKTDDTSAIQKALDKCGEAGGRVTMKEGRTYLTKALTIWSKTEFNIPLGSVLLIDNDRKNWPAGKSIIQGNNKSINNVAITGPGRLDGQGLVWWQNRGKDKYDKNRPSTLHLGGSHALVHNITFVNPPNHCMELYTHYTEVSHVTVLAPPSTAPEPTESHNTDAVDVHGSPFYVHDCHFDTGDDNIAAHANDTLVEDSYFGNGHGASIGSLGSKSYLTNITFRNIVFNGTDAAVKIKVHYDATEGHLSNVLYENLVIHNSKEPISVTLDYDEKNGGGPPKFTIEHLQLRNITSYNSTFTGELCRGLGTCKDFVFDNINFVGSSSWTCPDSKSECDCFKNVQGQADNVSPKVRKCLQNSDVLVI